MPMDLSLAVRAAASSASHAGSATASATASISVSAAVRGVTDVSARRSFLRRVSGKEQKAERVLDPVRSKFLRSVSQPSRGSQDEAASSSKDGQAVSFNFSALRRMAGLAILPCSSRAVVVFTSRAVLVLLPLPLSVHILKSSSMC